MVKGGSVPVEECLHPGIGHIGRRRRLCVLYSLFSVSCRGVVLVVGGSVGAVPAVDDGKQGDGVGRGVFGDEFVEFAFAVWRADEVEGREASCAEVVIGGRCCVAKCT